VPAGLYVDEASIAVDAYLISETGRDQFDVHWPLFFESLGEYKSPVYIYATALVFQFAEPSDFTLRLTSALFFLLAYLGMLFSLSALRVSRGTLLWAALALAFLPQIFTQSRFAMQAISQVGLLAWVPGLAIRAFEGTGSKTGRQVNAALLGLILGVSIYSYATSRLLSPLLALVILAFFWRTKDRHALWIFAITFGLLCLPFVAFYIQDASALRGRFKAVSYTDDSIPFIEKVRIFFVVLRSHLSLDFWLLSGDANRRHATGFGGEYSWSVALAFLFGLFQLCKGRLGAEARRLIPSQPRLRHQLFVFLLVALSLVPVALTNESTPHAIRTIAFGYFVVLFAALGFDELLAYFRPGRSRVIFLTVAFSALALESALFVSHYFGDYVAVSAQVFGSDSVDESLRAVIESRGSSR